ncbi:MAG: glycosyltransferase family 2 protein [Chitinophagaceae bacterium]
MNQPLVSIVTINYDTPEVTAAMLESLSTLDYPNWEVIVVDNASPSFSSSCLKDKYPFIRHISSPVNLGFAGGNNLGLHYAKGEYILLLNNDTEVTPTLISGMVQYMMQHPECGIACPKIKYHALPGTIQYAGTVGLHPLTSRSYNIGYLEMDRGQFDETRKTDQPNGAAMMIPATLLKEVGSMSELFFLYYEELDWAARFKEKGYEIHYVGTTEIVHKESVSTGINSAFKTFYLYRNRLLYIRRNYKGMRFYIAATFFNFFSTPFHIVRHAGRREWSHSRSIWKALLWNYRNNAYREPEILSTTVLKSLGIQ